MKMRYIFISLLVMICVGLSVTYSYIGVGDITDIDMTEYNDKFKQVSDYLDGLDKITQNSEKLKAFEKKSKCKVYVIGDEFYDSNVGNSIKHQDVLFDYYKNGKYTAKIVFPGQQEKIKGIYYQVKKRIFISFAMMAVLMTGIIAVIYISYIRPFNTLQDFAKQIAKGNLDMPLKVYKNNYFGAFTESFDIMREELAKAKKGEYEANKSKKELVAELSHDIKTPVATIKAMCEVIPFQTKDEKVIEKTEIIGRKADVIDSLITDMFHATLEELKVLKVNPAEELSTIIIPMIKQMDYFGKIHIHGECPECLIYADKLRLNQVIDNVINNSYKYADTDIDIDFSEITEAEREGIVITLHDYGNGVSDEDMPLITEKFYRGANSDGCEGSGLGLYLSQLFMSEMEGELNCYNDNGFVVKIIIKKVR
ncbi:MAG: HAMP domain-containing histidine kinase [Lachnospiraceae bacterium]|nr:HAMP domain-containing histidine kinase [Lachnospiraceae bacterium]